MKHFKRGVYVTLILLISGCTIIYGQNIEYKKAGSFLYMPDESLSGTMTIAESGTQVEQYHINDISLGIQLDYNLYYKNTDTNIQNEVHHIDSTLSNSHLLSIAQGGRKLIKISKEQLSRTDCPLTGSSSFSKQHPKLANKLASVQNLDIGLLEGKGILRSYTGCVYYDPNERAFPFFLISKTNPDAVLVAVIPEGIAGAVDYSWVDSLER